MHPLDLVRLTPLMQRTRGRPDISIGLIDGPVALDHPDLAGQPIRPANQSASAACSRASSVACMHGTFVAGILSARRGSAPGHLPGLYPAASPDFF